MEVHTMATLHAQIIKKNGKKEYAVLPYKEFIRINYPAASSGVLQEIPNGI
jgi:hypothetical protein